MNSPLTPLRQLRVLTRIWGINRTGYVFLPWIDGTADTLEARRRSYHEGRAFAWPTERSEAILEHLRNHRGDDLYFTPAVFHGKRRVEQNTTEERALWADLDPVNPETVPDHLKPTVAWETSPGRYQGVWLLNEPIPGASRAGGVNHRLSAFLEADPSGWDSTQLLRVPGRKNFKPGYEEPTGQLLWANGPRYDEEDFSELPKIGMVDVDQVEMLDEEFLTGINRHELWGKVRLKVSSRCREFMNAREAGQDRSEVLWEIERELADAGCNVAEIVALIRPTVWNKFAGRNDELKRLKTEAVKAIAQRQEKALDEPETPSTITWLSDLAAKPIPRPRWLIKDIWTVGGCGFIAGAPKSYKSWFALDMALSVSTGTPFLGMFRVAHQGPVLYLQEEDDLRLVMDRLSLIVEGRLPEAHWHGRLSLTDELDDDDSADDSAPIPGFTAMTWAPPSIVIPMGMHVQSGFIASDPTWQAWLADVVQSEKFALVVIDTLGTTAGQVDTDRAQDLMNQILKPLKDIAHTHQVSICVVHHNKKAADNQRAGQDMLGSVALHAWVDCALYARSKQDNELLIEREAKQASDLSLRLTIPHMDDSQGWEPKRSELTDEPGSQSAASSPVSTAGKKLATIMTHAGKGPFTADMLSTLLGRNPDGQIAAGIQNGYIERLNDGTFQPIRL